MVETSITVPFNGGTLNTGKRNTDFCVLEQGKHLQVWRQDAPDWCFARVWNYDFSTSSEGSIRMYEGDFTNLGDMFVEKLSSTQAVHCYRDNGTGNWYARVLTVDASDNISEGPRNLLSNFSTDVRWQQEFRSFGSQRWQWWLMITHPIDANTFWVLERQPNQENQGTTIYEFSVSGDSVTVSSLNEIQTNVPDSDADNNHPAIGSSPFYVRDIPGSTNKLLIEYDEIFRIDINGNLLSHVQVGSYNQTTIPISDTEFQVFYSEFTYTWDGTDGGGLTTPVNFDANHGGIFIWAEQVDANTFIIWSSSSSTVYGKVTRRLDPQTWEASNNTSSANTNASGLVWFSQINDWDNELYHHPKQGIYQFDANNFTMAYVGVTNPVFQVTFMQQT
jgi:hypothetical protein